MVDFEDIFEAKDAFEGRENVEHQLSKTLFHKLEVNQGGGRRAQRSKVIINKS